ncbi:hypothetical protein Phi46:1_gp38 [Cellulophaga phage phi46:1]|uniref:hypothetical protein n=1 Tax=Cellulophaga phage phi46:1 TaxID=1327974 RepID=UPI000351F038|nr:hypothetical protein Phi46:1_gp38 [Cellulophaga phage phi46:1]AGO47849.1 hypothetical protein Phi46:1_gp38 [Cellulophaga phage phi46:1]
MVKTCSKCHQTKSILKFPAKRAQCKECYKKVRQEIYKNWCKELLINKQKFHGNGVVKNN